MKNILKTVMVCQALMASFAASAYTTLPSETLKVWADPITIVADGKTISTLTICEHDTYDYTAFNMAFIVPEGITIAKVKVGRDWVDDCKLTARASSTHVITCGQPNPTTIKVISDSSTLANFYPDDEDGNPMDELFTIGLLASDKMEPGEYQVQILDVKFVLENADAFVLPHEPLYTTITVQPGPSTGVEDVAVPVDEGPWFDLLGRPAQVDANTGRPVPGIYIHDGRKVIVD